MLDLLADLAQVVTSLLRVLLGLPILKIQVPTTLVDVIGNHPRIGRDTAVPRPASLVGMTVAATVHERGINALGEGGVRGK